MLSEKDWAKERAKHMKKFHSWLAKGDKRQYYPRDVTEAMMWFVPKEFEKIPFTTRTTFLGETYWMINNHLYREDFGVFTKLEASEQEKEFMRGLLRRKGNEDVTTKAK